jgi:hypothetical protein
MRSYARASWLPVAALLVALAGRAQAATIALN